MLTQKGKELYLEVAPYYILAGRTERNGSEVKLEALTECPLGDVGSIKSFLREFFGKKAAGYSQAYCSIHPESRFLRKITLDAPVKARSDSYLKGLLREEFNIDPEQNAIRVLNGSDGNEFDPEEGLQKELVFCGAQKEEILREQDMLVGMGIYPKTLELVSLSALAGMMDYTSGVSMPTMVLEMRERDSQVYIFYRGQFDLIRTIPYGVESIIPIIQDELSLDSEEAAREVLFANKFDLKGKASEILKPLYKELQTLVDYYEVQTGQTVQSLFINALPSGLRWIEESLSKMVGLEPLSVGYDMWLGAKGVVPQEGVNLEELDNRWFGLVSMITHHSSVS